MKSFLYKTIPAVAAKAIQFLYKTSKWQHVGTQNVQSLLEQNKPAIIAFWHSQLLMMPKAWVWDKPFFMLLSKHKDGQLIGDTVNYFGIQSVSGSTNRGGVKAFLSLKKLLDEGNCIGMTPDGPRGPRHRASLGVIQLARLSGAPIIPATYTTKKYITVNSWDKLMIPLPFNKGVFIFDDPIYVAREDDLEQKRDLLESKLNLLLDTATSLVKS